MKRKVSELSGDVLNWAVELAKGTHWSGNGYFIFGGSMSPEARYDHNPEYAYSKEWSAAGPIIEIHSVSIVRCDDEYGRDADGFCDNVRIPVWAATIGQHSADEIYGSQGDHWGRAYSLGDADVYYGPTPLVAAMRSFVASELGDEVDVPFEK